MKELKIFHIVFNGACNMALFSAESAEQAQEMAKIDLNTEYIDLCQEIDPQNYGGFPDGLLVLREMTERVNKNQTRGNVTALHQYLTKKNTPPDTA